MPHTPGIYLAGTPAHIVQRGNNRNACFFSDDDYLFYLDVLGQGLQRYHVKLHAYCLMTNHVHLLMTPEDEFGISHVMQYTGRGYAQYINMTYHRNGRLWEERYKQSLVDADNYLLKCYRYIEMNPVAASMVLTPEQYRWSTYGWHAWGRPNEFINDHVLYEQLGSTSDIKQQAYREIFKMQVSEEDIHVIKESIEYNYPLGNERFKKQVEFSLARAVG